jgi:hypothetical protein
MEAPGAGQESNRNPIWGQQPNATRPPHGSSTLPGLIQLDNRLNQRAEAPARKPANAQEPTKTQLTRPKRGKPAEIPVPKREDVLRDLKKVAKPKAR